MQKLYSLFARVCHVGFYLLRALTAGVTLKICERELLYDERLIAHMKFGGWSHPRFRRVEFYLVRCLVAGIFGRFSVVIEL